MNEIDELRDEKCRQNADDDLMSEAYAEQCRGEGMEKCQNCAELSHDVAWRPYDIVKGQVDSSYICTGCEPEHLKGFSDGDPYNMLSRWLVKRRNKKQSPSSEQTSN